MILAEEVLALLVSVRMPELATAHCPGHQKTDNYIPKGNNLADQVQNKHPEPKTQVLRP